MKSANIEPFWAYPEKSCPRHAGLFGVDASAGRIPIDTRAPIATNAVRDASADILMSFCLFVMLVYILSVIDMSGAGARHPQFTIKRTQSNGK